MQLEGYVQADRVESVFAGRVARFEQRNRAALGSRITAARQRAEDAADAYRRVYAVVLDKRSRGKAIGRSLQAQLDAALVAMDRANDAVEAALAARMAA